MTHKLSCRRYANELMGSTIVLVRRPFSRLR